MNDDAFYEYHYYIIVQIDRYYRYCTFSSALFSAFEGKDPKPSTVNEKFIVPTVFIDVNITNRSDQNCKTLKKTENGKSKVPTVFTIYRC